MNTVLFEVILHNKQKYFITNIEDKTQKYDTAY